MLTIDDSVREFYPGAKMGILTVKDASYSSFMKEEDVAEFLQYLSRKYAKFERKELKELYPISAYIDYYKKFGSNYHLLAQLESCVTLERKKAQYQLCLMYILKRGGQLALNYTSRKLHRYYKRVTF